MSLAGAMCCALASACGGTPAWAHALLHDHPRTFDAIWSSSFAPAAGPLPSGGEAACDIDAILGRT